MGFEVKMTFEDYETYQMALYVFQKHCEEMIKFYEDKEASYLQQDYKRYLEITKKMKNKGE